MNEEDESYQLTPKGIYTLLILYGNMDEEEIDVYNRHCNGLFEVCRETMPWYNKFMTKKSSTKLFLKRYSDMARIYLEGVEKHKDNILIEMQ